MKTLSILLMLILVVALTVTPAHAGPRERAAAALALAAAVPTLSTAPVCRCGPDCPLGGCADCQCEKKARSRSIEPPVGLPPVKPYEGGTRPAGEGWQYDQVNGHWWRPVTLAPMTAPPVYNNFANVGGYAVERFAVRPRFSSRGATSPFMAGAACASGS